MRSGKASQPKTALNFSLSCHTKRKRKRKVQVIFFFLFLTSETKPSTSLLNTMSYVKCYGMITYMTSMERERGGLHLYIKGKTVGGKKAKRAKN